MGISIAPCGMSNPRGSYQSPKGISNPPIGHINPPWCTPTPRGSTPPWGISIAPWGISKPMGHCIHKEGKSRVWGGYCTHPGPSQSTPGRSMTLDPSKRSLLHNKNTLLEHPSRTQFLKPVAGAGWRPRTGDCGLVTTDLVNADWRVVSVEP